MEVNRSHYSEMLTRESWWTISVALAVRTPWAKAQSCGGTRTGGDQSGCEDKAAGVGGSAS